MDRPELDVTFRRMMPTDDILQYTRNLADRLAAALPGEEAEIRVVLERLAPDRFRRASIRVGVQFAAGGLEATVGQTDPDPFLGLRNAFAVLSYRLTSAGKMAAPEPSPPPATVAV
ncbi:MAG: hypothetical protein ACOCXM_11065 [Myxococcota bacterium]